MNREKSIRKKKKVLGKQKSVKYSIVCGTENPASLGCTVYELEGGETATFFTANRFHEGHGHIMHGGIISAVMDELMGRSTHMAMRTIKQPIVTAGMQINYKAPLVIGEKYYAFGKVVESEGRCYNIKSIILSEENDIMAEADGVFVTVTVAGDDTCEDYKALDLIELDENDPTEL